MLAGVLLSLFLSIATPRTIDPKLTGVWVLSQQKSDWGGLTAPEEVILMIDQSDRSVAIWEITTSKAAREVSYRQIILNGEKCGEGSHRACFVTAQSVAEERWELSEMGELIVDREMRQGSRLIHQRLVLEPSVELSE